ncbi:TonB-dependent receptor [Phenylobacterium sp.]|uniref:TonB-dependent receptor n=1 Tax=Phenylobacterium sp. TaxID=1871053 RepID=UPI0025D4DDF6|nr:TonB-dependent receptor [Phenylobacterium sp.]
MLSCSAAALCGAGTPAAAQDAASHEAGIVQEVVVTATRRETKLQDTPLAITAVGGESIARQGVRDLQELSLAVPSLVMGPDAAFGFNASIRGIDSAASGIGADTPVGFYVDGVYLGRNASGVFGLANIERIEILRGPQGTLFGRNATAGAVSIITKLPTSDTQFMAEGTYGSYANLTLRGMASGAITDNLAGSIAIFHNRVKSYADINSFTGDEMEPIRESNVRGVLRWRPNERTDVIVRGDVGASDDSAVWPDVVRLPGYVGTAATVTPAAIQATYGHINDIDLNNNPYIQRRQGGLMLEVNHDVTDTIRLTSLSAYRDSFASFLVDTDAGPHTLARSWMESERQNQYSQELRFASSGSSPFQWVAGLYYFREHAKVRYFIDRFNVAPVDEIAFNPINTTKSYAVFGEASYLFFDRLTLKVGARYTRETKDFANTSVRDLNPNPNEQLPRVLPFPDALRRETSKTWSDVSPKVSADFKVNDDIMIYASAQKGFKSGGNNFTSADFVASPTFNPETVWSYEAGIRSEWLDRRLRLNVTAFYMDYKQLQMRVNIGPGQALFRNAANAVSKGIEADGVFVVAPGLTLNGGVTILSSKFQDYNFFAANPAGCLGGRFDAGSLTCSYSGNDLQRSPHFKGTIGALYQFDAGPAEVDAEVTYSYTSSQYYDDRNLLGPGAYSGLNAYVALRPHESNWALRIWGKNLTNERYYGHLNPIGAAILGTPNAPRTYGITATFTY